MRKKVKRRMRFVQIMVHLSYFEESLRSFVTNFFGDLWGFFYQPVKQRYDLMAVEAEEEIEREIFSLTEKHQFQLALISERIRLRHGLLTVYEVLLDEVLEKPKVFEKVSKMIEEFNESWKGVLMMKLSDGHVLVGWPEYFKEDQA